MKLQFSASSVRRPAPVRRSTFRVRRSPAWVLLSGMLLACSGAGEAAAEAAPGTSPVLSGCEPDYPPYCIVTPDNRADGLSVELLRATLKAVGRDVVFKTGPWTELKQELADGQLEVLPLVGRTPEREADYDFSIPYITMHGALFIRDDTADILTWHDLKDKRVAVMKGDNAEEYVRRAGISDRILTPHTFTAAFEMLVAGQADAVVAQKLMGLSLLKHMGVTNIRVVGKPNEEFTQVFCFAVREGNRELLSLLNEGLAIVIAGGLTRQLEHKWMGVDPSEAARARVILYGGDHAFPPYEFLDNRGRPAGFNIDLARAVAREIGADISFQLGPWSEVRRKIENGDLDLACMFYSASRERLLDFSVPHTRVYQAVFAGDTSPPYRRFEDVQSRRLSVQKGDIMHDYALERGLGDRLTVAATSEEALALLAVGRVDYALGSHFQGLYWLKKHGWKDLRAVDAQLLGSEYCYAVPKGNTALRDLFNDGLKQVKESGEYRKIYNQWLGVLEPDYERQRITRIVLLLLLATTLMVAIAFGIIFVLRRQVARRTRELTLERAFLDRVINAIGDPVFVKDGKRRFVIVNDALCAIVGSPRERLLGADDDAFFPGEQVDVFRQVDTSVLDTGDENLNEEALTNVSSGEVRTIITRKSRYIDPDGKRFLVGVIHDITDQKAAEAMQSQQQRLASVGTLARGMAHEINNPIMGVMNYAELIKQQAAGNAPLVEFAGEILAEGRRVARMTQSLLGFTEQKANMAITIVTPEDLLAAVLPPAADAAQAKGIALSCDIPADLPLVSCRQSQIELVVTALLSNALEAWESGTFEPGRSTLGGGDRKIVVSAERIEVGSRNAERGSEAAATRNAEDGVQKAEATDLSSVPPSDFRVPPSDVLRSAFPVPTSWLRLTVEDNGPGIPNEIRERVFDPFFTTKDRTKHSGLGLWISRSIAQEHGGELTCESPSAALRVGQVGQGARFHLDLPAT